MGREVCPLASLLPLAPHPVCRHAEHWLPPTREQTGSRLDAQHFLHLICRTGLNAPPMCVFCSITLSKHSQLPTPAFDWLSKKMRLGEVSQQEVRVSFHGVWSAGIADCTPFMRCAAGVVLACETGRPASSLGFEHLAVALC